MWESERERQRGGDITGIDAIVQFLEGSPTLSSDGIADKQRLISFTFRNICK